MFTIFIAAVELVVPHRDGGQESEDDVRLTVRGRGRITIRVELRVSPIAIPRGDAVNYVRETCIAVPVVAGAVRNARRRDLGAGAVKELDLTHLDRIPRGVIQFRELDRIVARVSRPRTRGKQKQQAQIASGVSPEAASN